MKIDKGAISNPRILARRELLKFIFASPIFGAMAGLPVSGFAAPDRATPEIASQAKANIVAAGLEKFIDIQNCHFLEH